MSDPCRAVPSGSFGLESSSLLAVLLPLAVMIHAAIWLSFRWIWHFRMDYYNVREAGTLPPLFRYRGGDRSGGWFGFVATAILALRAFFL